MKHLALLFAAVFIFAVATAEAKLSVDSLTNYNLVCYPLLNDQFVVVDTMPTTPKATEEESETKKTIVVLHEKDMKDISEEEVAEEDVSEDEVVDENISEVKPEKPNMKGIIDYSHLTTILFDTERNAAGNAVRRHIYYYDGYANNLADDNCSVLGVSKIKRMSFPAGEEGLQQWRQGLLRLVTSKNPVQLAKSYLLREKWQKGELDDSTFQAEIYQIRQNLPQPCVMDLKPMGETECGDVIDALSVMMVCDISRFAISELTHADSVMVFNALYPEKEMPAGVNYYSYGETSRAALINADDIVLPSILADNLEFGYCEDILKPVVSVEIKENKNNRDGALAALTIDDALVKEILNSSEGEIEPEEAKVEEAHVEEFTEWELDEAKVEEIKDDALDAAYAAYERTDINILESGSYKELVRMHGDDVAEPEWLEVNPLENHQANRFTATISDVSKMFFSNRAFRRILVGGRGFLLYTDKHTPYRAMKCVVDNWRKNNFNKFILAY